MPIPDYQSIMLPLLRSAADGVVTRKVADAKLMDEFGLTETERTQLLPSGRQGLFNNRVHWAATYLVKAGLLRRPQRGHLEITEEGRNFLATGPLVLRLQQLKKYPAFMQFYKSGQSTADSNAAETDVSIIESSKASTDVATETPEERLAQAAEIVNDKLRSDLIEAIMTGSPEFFERLIIDLLVKMGYGGSFAEAAEHLGKSGDGGIDGVIKGDRLGLDAVYIQAKRYSSDNVIGPGAIQQFIGALSTKGASKGVFVTTSRFSDGAKRIVPPSQRLVLMDGRQLTDLMIEFGVGVRTVNVFEIKKIDADYFDDSAE
jgi:restriction system protein